MDDATNSLAMDAPQAPSTGAAWLVVLCLACDFLMVPVFISLDGPQAPIRVIPALGIIGCVLAQGNLLAAWLAWSEGPFLRRLALHWIIAVGLYLIWLVGFAVALAGGRIPPIIAATVALGVPLVSIAAQFPLWVARQWFGWRLVRGTTAAAVPETPLAIRDLMVATLMVAASLALARVAPSPDKGEVWPIWAFGFIVASVISSIALLPAGALLMRMEPFRRGLVWSVLYAAAWVALPWIIAARVWTYGLTLLPPWPLFVGLTSLMLAFAATLIFTAAIARNRGYRLTSRRLPHSPSGRGPG
jgi:hypothetical protein